MTTRAFVGLFVALAVVVFVAFTLARDVAAGVGGAVTVLVVGAIATAVRANTLRRQSL
jgi:hypothetical protein